jgi:hypothetical protein
MKISVDQKLVAPISKNIINEFLSLIEENDWFVTRYRETVGSMSKTNSIPLMHTKLCASGFNTREAIDDIKPEALYDKYKDVLNLVLEELKKHYKFNKYAAFLARLNPRSAIDSHVDKGVFLTTCHRVHVPLQTNQSVAYAIDGKEYYWEAGNIYEFDNTKMHGVFNRSDEYRIHLVLNLYPEE